MSFWHVQSYLEGLMSVTTGGGEALALRRDRGPVGMLGEWPHRPPGESVWEYLVKQTGIREADDAWCPRGGNRTPGAVCKKWLPDRRGGSRNRFFSCDIVCALHWTAAVKSIDLANCYDTVSHTIVDLSLRSFKVRATMVAMMLSVLQVMKFYLRTSFGQSTTSYGGNKDDPTMGLAQGNGVSPLPWLPGCQHPDETGTWSRL